MFRGLSATSRPPRRAARRLATIAAPISKSATGRRVNTTPRPTFENYKEARGYRQEHRLDKQHPGPYKMAGADGEFLRRQQQQQQQEEEEEEPVAGADAYMKQQRKSRPSEKSQRVVSSTFDYDSVDAGTGCSVVQQRFDALVREAVLKYGPPLPADFVSSNDLAGVSYQKQSGTSTSYQDDGADGQSFYFYDEVHVKLPELFDMIRRVDPSFSVYTHCGGIPFSLLVKNCLYLRAWGGEIHFMRCLTQGGQSGSTKAETDQKIKVSLAKYKMREAPSSDGLRQGPKPWIHSYRMV